MTTRACPRNPNWSAKIFLGPQRTFCSSVNQWLQCSLRVVPVHLINQRRVYPTSRFDRIKPANDHLKLKIESIIFVLNSTVVHCKLTISMFSGSRSNFNDVNALNDESGGGSSFWLANIGSPGNELEQQHRGYLNRNWRFKLETSMVSISITWMSLNPDRAKFLRISQPRPPAPITRILKFLKFWRA